MNIPLKASPGVSFRFTFTPEQTQEEFSQIPPELLEEACEAARRRILETFDREVIRQVNRQWFFSRGLIP